MLVNVAGAFTVLRGISIPGESTWESAGGRVAVVETWKGLSRGWCPGKGLAAVPSTLRAALGVLGGGMLELVQVVHSNRHQRAHKEFRRRNKLNDNEWCRGRH